VLGADAERCSIKSYALSKMIQMQRVFWLSGSPCGGKSTVSTALAGKYNWNIYHVDDQWDSHCERAHPSVHPTFYSISRVTGDALWLRPLEEQIRTEPDFINDIFPLILEDIGSMLDADDRPLIVDASVVPKSIVAHLPSKVHIFYLIPEERFQRHQYALRPSIEPTLAKTSNRELAFSNWMARDAAYARWLLEEVKRYALPHLVVDGSQTLEERISMIGDHFRDKNRA
jgi:hypothetical protein